MRATPVARSMLRWKVALDQQLFHLGVLYRFRGGRWLEPGLMATPLALVFGVALAAAIAANVFTAIPGADVLRKYHAVR